MRLSRRQLDVPRQMTRSAGSRWRRLSASSDRSGRGACERSQATSFRSARAPDLWLRILHRPSSSVRSRASRARRACLDVAGRCSVTAVWAYDQHMANVKDVEDLRHPGAEELLHTPDPARLAYNGRDGFPRVI